MATLEGASTPVHSSPGSHTLARDLAVDDSDLSPGTVCQVRRDGHLLGSPLSFLQDHR